ncbi:transcriptional regulator, XRE family with cupin sensor [Nitratireductor aquibiodomus]|uniref:Transcriptional regulator, XRE family with cupin sensor n=2 Tax=Nitratireductor aquibiodomus TaxID=204799 RepID=A0A1H4JNG4_9HYPH|nr:transcriptional regulator, XRE family with cupin sensor [Nitratireductor aquibiodomus]
METRTGKGCGEGFMDDFDIGSRLKAMRTAGNLSQRQLAEQAGVPHAQISNIEKNKISPSISTLRKVLGGMGVSMADFFEPEREDNPGPFFGRDELIDLTSRVAINANAPESGLLVLRQIGDARLHNLQILHEVYEPGADTGETMLQHASSEGGYVVEGELALTVGDEMRVLKAGEAYLFDSRQPHRFQNLSDRRTIVVSACTPPYL